jgi:RNA polymerase sigma factor (sigma-70 family)
MAEGTTGSGGAIDLSSDSDYDLLEIMTWKDSDPEPAREAWAEFYRRHVKYLYSACFRYTKGLGGGQEAEDLTTETFRLVYERGAKTFRRPESDDPEYARRRIRAWVGRIAQNLSRSSYRGRHIQEVQLDDIAWDSLSEDLSSAETAPSQTSIRMRELIESELTERELFILRVTSLYYDEREPNRHLPSHVLDDIAQQFGITRENIRQIKSRAMKKIERAMATMTPGE